jgi:methylated-DNA-[protein]-cysteine S-methyltransferase/AraC family transcriptional regulator of adaptative response/methylated-DNA-[protein]-cysteine methyltransferase
MTLATDRPASVIPSPKESDTRVAAEIAFATRASPIGEVLVARRAIGVCAIFLGSDAEALERDLATSFPGSKLTKDEPRLRDDLSKVVRFIETPDQGLDLPLDIGGTPFQRSVWEVLRTVPVGATITYSALARRIGRPSAVRAVASACAANAIALGIPCHRVILNNGALSGYRWGEERKRALLERESRS